MKIIESNPYRYLGVFANASVRERVANSARLRAFLQVGRQPDFPLDLKQYLPPVARTSESVAKAEADLTLPNDRVRYAQFWFIKSTPIDEIAFNHLFAGNMDMAVELWKRRERLSSLQNRMMCYLLRGKYIYAAGVADRLYQKYSQDFCILIDPTLKLSQDDFINNFFDTLATEHDVDLASFSWERCSQRWKDILNERLVSPVISQIEDSIGSAKSVKRDSPSGRYNAGVKLMEDTRPLIARLKSFCSDTDIRYQNVMDKLANEILQCGIDYYNKSDDDDKGEKAMPLQKYALQIAVGPMAKSRCKDNVDILQKNIDSLPPREVFAEDRAIKAELRKFCNLSETIANAVTLLNNAKPHLQSIKAKLGAGNSYYLKMSTLVVNNALGNVIEEVNNAQKDETIEFQGRQVPISMLLDRETKIRQIKSALRSAWDATKIMDTFDMEADFRTKRYNPNRSTLQDMCRQLGISTSVYTPSCMSLMSVGQLDLSNLTYTTRPKPTPRPQPAPRPQPRVVPTPKKEEKEINPIVAIVIIHVIWGIIGVADSKDGDIGDFFFGMLAGIAFWLIPINFVAYYIINWIYKQINK